MSLSMYQASIPVFVRTLTSLTAILDKAETYAAEKKIEPAVLLGARLAPDMFPLTRQVQIATDGVKGCVARLSGQDVPSYPDTETSFAELKARIEKTVAFAKSAKPAQIDGTEERDIALKAGPRELKFKGQDYLLTFVLPNLFFHVTTAYAILRHNGLNIGKLDFLGS